MYIWLVFMPSHLTVLAEALCFGVVCLLHLYVCPDGLVTMISHERLEHYIFSMKLTGNIH